MNPDFPIAAMNSCRHASAGRALLMSAVIAAGCLPAGGAVARADDGLPRVLVIGDHGWGERSPPGSCGYTEIVAERLAGRAVVKRSPECGVTTAKAIEHLDAWLGQSHWDVIHFSFGLHDVEHDDTGRPTVSLEEFERNLETIVERLQATGATLVWTSATPVPDDASQRRPDDIDRYNAAARRLMDRRGIPVNDLHAAGAAGLATHVVAAIEPALAKRTSVPAAPPLGGPAATMAAKPRLANGRAPNYPMDRGARRMAAWEA